MPLHHNNAACIRHNDISLVLTADVQSFRLLPDRQIACTVDHRFALNSPALVSAPSKKSFSSVSSPILACSDFTSTLGCVVALLPGPNALAADSRS